MSAAARQKDAEPSVLSLAQLLEQQPPTAPPCLVEPGLLPPQGVLFVGGEPKVGKSLLVANLAMALASGSGRAGFTIPLRAACWSASSSFPCRSLFPVWRRCAVGWEQRPTITCWWTLVPEAICSMRRRDPGDCPRHANDALRGHARRRF